MKITFEVPESRASFILELLRGLPYVTLRGKAAVLPDDTAHLGASPANAARLRAAMERDQLGLRETHEFPAQ